MDVKSTHALAKRGEYASMYQVNRDTLQYASPDVLVMHPGPINRGIELDDAAADGVNSVITSQIENGIFVRMASLYWVFGGESAVTPEPVKATRKKAVAAA